MDAKKGRQCRDRLVNWNCWLVLTRRVKKGNCKRGGGVKQVDLSVIMRKGESFAAATNLEAVRPREGGDQSLDRYWGCGPKTGNLRYPELEDTESKQENVEGREREGTL